MTAEFEITLRTAQPDDLLDLLTLYRYLHPNDPTLPLNDELNDLWQSLLTDRNSHYLVACQVSRHDRHEPSHDSPIRNLPTKKSGAAMCDFSKDTAVVSATDFADIVGRESLAQHLTDNRAEKSLRQARPRLIGALPLT